MERIKILERQKTALVVPEKEDCKEWMKINDLEINQYLLIYGKILTLEQEEDFYEKATKDETQRLFSIYSLEDKKIIGNCSFHDISSIHGTGSLGIAIMDKDFHGKGHGTEVIKMILEFGFKVLGLRKITLDVFGNNPRAKHVYEKCGFKEVGRSKKHFYRNGEYFDKILMEIFKEEWEK